MIYVNITIYVVLSEVLLSDCCSLIGMITIVEYHTAIGILTVLG